MQFWTQELMGVVVPKPTFPIPSPPGLMGAAVAQLPRGKSPSFPPRIPWLSTPDPKLRTSLLLRAGASNRNCLTRGHLRDLGGRGRGSRERSYQGKLRTGSRPLGLGQVAGTVAPLPSCHSGPGAGEGGKALTSTGLTLLQVLVITRTLSRGHQEVICVLGVRGGGKKGYRWVSRPPPLEV